MELDQKVRWKNLREDIYRDIVYHSLSPDSLIKQVRRYRFGLYETPKDYKDGYAKNDGTWVKYYYNGRLRCTNREEICRYLYGYLCFLLKVGVDDDEALWYFGLCYLIDVLEYRRDLFGCSSDNKNKVDSIIQKVIQKRPECRTAVKDDREFCLDSEKIKGLSAGEKTRLQKGVQKKLTDERIEEMYDPEISVRKNAERIGQSASRIQQWINEFRG